MSHVWVYVTASSEDDARRMARTLVRERLAACANILGPITSIYWWQGELQEDRETALILKTRADLVDALTRRIKDLHAYDCPCVVALPMVAGNADFLDWIGTETRTAE